MSKVAEKETKQANYAVGERIDVTASFEITAIPEVEKITEIEEDRKLYKSLIKAHDVHVEKALNYGEVEVVVSNSAIDRYGDSITMEGIDLTQVRRNPVVLWAHQYSGLPIGRILKLWRANGNLMAKIALDYDIYDFADTVYKMILRGTINAVSIGGLVLEFGKNEDGSTDWFTIAKLEMVELSVVPVGAHPDALVTSKSLGMKPDQLRKQFEQFVEKSMLDKIKLMPEDEIKQHIASLKTLTSALEAAYTEASTDTEEEQPATKSVRKVRKLVLARSAAKQCDKQAELIIASINSKLKEGNSNNG